MSDDDEPATIFQPDGLGGPSAPDHDAPYERTLALEGLSDMDVPRTVALSSAEIALSGEFPIVPNAEVERTLALPGFGTEGSGLRAAMPHSQPPHSQPPHSQPPHSQHPHSQHPQAPHAPHPRAPHSQGTTQATGGGLGRAIVIGLLVFVLFLVFAAAAAGGALLLLR